MKSIHKTALVLLHYPVTNRAGELITTSVTNLDIHDLARSARTYEVDHYFLVTPILEQKELLERILSHWNRGRSFEWHPDRAEALSRVKCLPDFEAVKTELIERYPDQALEVAMPDARPIPGQKSYSEVRASWSSEKAPGTKVIVLGTGWGIAEPFFKEVHTFLGPVYGPKGSEGYNHLSVRAAGAVILDRLVGLQ
jgi:hypothetical protein